MLTLISFVVIFSLIIISLKFFSSHNVYEKIIGFYFIFSNFIILVLVNAVTNFDDMLDIIIVLFLLQFVAVLFLLFNRKKI